MILENKGEDLTITNFTPAGTDEYGDREYTEATVSAKGIVQQRGELITSGDESGLTVARGIRIFLPVDTDIYEPSDARPHASIVTRQRTGEKFVVDTVFDEGKDFLRVECEKQA